MDFDRLNIHEAAKLSKIIETLGTPVSVDELVSCVSICEACATLYRKELMAATENNRRHGDA